EKNECLICKVPCRTVLLSKHTDSDIQAFFMSIDGLCRKYSRETSKISEFQENHRKRLLAFYREKISRLEESLRKSVLQIEQLQSMRSSQQTAFGTIKNSVSTKPHGCLLLPPHPSQSDRVESMDVDLSPSPIRKREIAAGPVRISVISPPQDGRM
uniref:Ring finger protein 212 n=1 Tax=Saimiri boliviensis boliviensis TaxID=39432 RepID=A0A2K6TJ04_SAIBB